MEINQRRNFYILKSPVYNLIKNADSIKEIERIQNKDIDNLYNENGISTLQAYDMCERMYLVVKSILNNKGVPQDYKLKKGDIIKLGRAKFLVREINIT